MRKGRRTRKGSRRREDVEKEGSLFCQRHFPAIGLPLEAAAVAVAVVDVASVVEAVASGHKMLQLQHACSILYAACQASLRYL